MTIKTIYQVMFGEKNEEQIFNGKRGDALD